MCLSQFFEKEVGIHTFLLRRELHDYAEYRKYKLVLQRYVSKRRDNGNDCYIKSNYFEVIGYYGLTAVLQMKNGFAQLDLIVNPANLLSNSYRQTDIFTQKELCKVVSVKINLALTNLKLSVDLFKLSRIDLCANINMTSQLLQTYLKLGNKSYKAHNIEKEFFDDSESNEHSLTLKCRSYEVEIYDKEYEVAKRTSNPLPEGTFGKKLRIEVRLAREIIRHYINYPEILYEVLQAFFDEKEEIMRDKLEYCFYPGTYTTLENALCLIKSGKFNQKTTEIMEEILRSKTNIIITLNTIQQKFSLSDKATQRIKKKFQKIGISVTTITIRDAKSCACDFLPSFYDIIAKKKSLIKWNILNHTTHEIY